MAGRWMPLNLSEFFHQGLHLSVLHACTISITFSKFIFCAATSKLSAVWYILNVLAFTLSSSTMQLHLINLNLSRILPILVYIKKMVKPSSYQPKPSLFPTFKPYKLLNSIVLIKFTSKISSMHQSHNRVHHLHLIIPNFLYYPSFGEYDIANVSKVCKMITSSTH